MIIIVNKKDCRAVKNMADNYCDDLDIKAIDAKELEDVSGLSRDENQETTYPDAVIQISRDQYSIKDMCDMVESGDFKIDPDFQRKEVWNNIQKCELVESILMGVPLPTMYVFEQKDGKKQVIDGRQRLTALKQFLDNKLILKKLKVLSQFNGLRFDTLEGRYQSKYRRFQLSVIVVEPPTPERIKIDIFSRVNRGGTTLSNQEMRNALFYGKATQLLAELADSKEFKKATGNSVSDKRMKDRYIILRFISFYMLREKKINYDYSGDLEDFLAYSMNYLNHCNDNVLISLASLFRETMTKFSEAMGEDGFRFASINGNTKRPVNMLLFETLSYIFTKDLPPLNNNDLAQIVNSFKASLDNDNEFKKSIDSKPNIDYRFINVFENWRNLCLKALQ